jgi:hypothetical protein
MIRRDRPRAIEVHPPERSGDPGSYNFAPDGWVPVKDTWLSRRPRNENHEIHDLREALEMETQLLNHLQEERSSQDAEGRLEWRHIAGGHTREPAVRINGW